MSLYSAGVVTPFKPWKRRGKHELNRVVVFCLGVGVGIIGAETVQHAKAAQHRHPTSHIVCAAPGCVNTYTPLPERSDHHFRASRNNPNTDR